jgi:hypothetical protein
MAMHAGTRQPVQPSHSSPCARYLNQISYHRVMAKPSFVTKKPRVLVNKGDNSIGRMSKKSTEALKVLYDPTRLLKQYGI